MKYISKNKTLPYENSASFQLLLIPATFAMIFVRERIGIKYISVWRLAALILTVVTVAALTQSTAAFSLACLTVAYCLLCVAQNSSCISRDKRAEPYDHGVSWLDDFIPKSVSREVVTRWIEPIFFILCGGCVLWKWSVPIGCAMIFSGFALHLVESVRQSKDPGFLVGNIPSFLRPQLTPLRVGIAYLAALGTDAIQLPLNALSATLALAVPAEIIDAIADLITLVTVVSTVGFRWQLLPCLALELLPVVDLFPTWLASVAFMVSRGSALMANEEPEDYEPTVATRLNDLIDLRHQVLISEVEFEERRKRILDEI